MYLALAWAGVTFVGSRAEAYSSSAQFSWFSYRNAQTGWIGESQSQVAPYYTPMWNYNQGYCFVTNNSWGGIGTLDGGSDTAYMTLDANNNYVLAGKNNGPVSWLQFGGDPTHSGNNPGETQISVSNAGSLVAITNLPRPSPRSISRPSSCPAPTWRTGACTTCWQASRPTNRTEPRRRTKRQPGLFCGGLRP